MTVKKIIIFFGVLGIICFLAIYPWLNKRDLEIVMLNIGQGDAFYLRTPQGRDIIIDGGPDRTILSEIGRVMPPYDHKIELMVATHDDMDHIAGLVELFGGYEIDTLLTNGGTRGTNFSKALFLKAGEQSKKIINLKRGDRLEIEDDLWLEILNPAIVKTVIDDDENNDSSLVFILRYKNFSAMFTGDAGENFEQEWLESLDDREFIAPDLDLLKVSHHGSRTGTSGEFVKAIKPEVALISAGINNKFGHPHAGPLWRLTESGARIWRTDIHGRIKCASSGQEFSCEPD